MAGQADTTTSAAILKTKYTQPKVYWLAYKNNPTFATIKKDTTFDGDFQMIAVQTEIPQGGGSSVATAQTNLNPGVYKRFALTRIEDFGVARVKGQALRAAQKNTGALIDLWTREMDGILLHVTRSAAINLMRTGTGSRGVIGSISTTTITLATLSDITNFAVGMSVQLTATDGGATLNAGAVGVITGIDRTAGKITFGSNVTTIWAAAAATNFIIRNGDAVGAVVASKNTMVTGMQGWVPDGTGTNRPQPAESFFGLDRSSDGTRLAGNYYDATGVPMQEALLEAIAMVAVEAPSPADGPDRVIMHPRDRANLVKELGAKVQYTKVTQKVPGSSASIGFDAVEIESDSGKALIFSDINQPRNRTMVTKWDTWAFYSLGPAPMVLDFDSNNFLRVTNDDVYEVRCGYYGQVGNYAPALTNHVYNFGL